MVDVVLIFVVAIILIFLIWISSALFGAPFQPSSDKEVKEILELAKIKKGQKTADLGSGNGKIVIEFAKRGAEAHGFEINPLLVLLSQKRIKKLGLQDNAFIHWKNFMKQNFSDFDIITSFQISYIMPDLEKKLTKELKHDSKVISNTWKFPKWKPKKKLGRVYLYKK
jgi:16S rRNA A1518/A1519 N6-dimethyltransferase RsmA/KsgA/DIM1 with predicted DNA glycosylase/AP lyase activity